MKGRIRFSHQFRDDIDDIWSYIAADNIEAADRFIDSFEPVYHILADHPNIGRLWPELKAGLRSFPHKSYSIYYFPTDDGALIFRDLHAARDIQEIFGDQ